jgi:hypothetical protein|nr:MAG TPA: hypothetical protein [Caudoviricetes sp.]
MAKYRLLKDCLGVKAGTICETNGDGFAELKADDGCIVATLSTKADWFGEYFEEVGDGCKRWRADRGGDYYCVDSDGSLVTYGEYNDNTDNGLYKIGNYFKTAEEAKRWRDYMVALQTIKDDAKGFVPDWWDRGGCKHFVVYDHCGGALTTDSTSTLNFSAPVYFASEDDAYESTKKHRKEWLTVLGVKEDNSDDMRKK